METVDIMRDIRLLPISQRMLMAEYIIHSIRQEGELPLSKAAERLRTDYLIDPELTAFTQLDSESFYEAR